MYKKLINTVYREGVSQAAIQVASEVYWSVAQRLPGRAMRSQYGPLFYKNTSDRTFRFYIDGVYGSVLADILRYIDKPFSFIDVGANQGLYSILAAENLQCRRVYSFEPVRHTFELLTRNVELNRVSDRVRLLQFAISNENRPVEISFDKRHSGKASISNGGINSVSQSIDCVTSMELNTLLDDSELPVFVKIDTEGHESVVIEQLQKANVWRNVDGLFFEVDDEWIDSRRLIDALMALGYREKWRTPGVESHGDVLMVRSDSLLYPSFEKIFRVA
jgi:FkbM family methyltransferase